MLKLNNKGFAIASILYSIMVLFLVLLLSILGMLGSRKATLDKNKKDIVNELNHAYLVNKIVFEPSRDIEIVYSENIDVASLLMEGVTAIGATEEDIIGPEYIINNFNTPVDEIVDGEYNVIYTANNGGITIIGSRNVTFTGFSS